MQRVLAKTICKLKHLIAMVLRAPLGETTTNSSGEYRITFSEPAYKIHLQNAKVLSW
jgi:hypothetical protein